MIAAAYGKQWAYYVSDAMNISFHQYASTPIQIKYCIVNVYLPLSSASTLLAISMFHNKDGWAAFHIFTNSL